MAALVLAASCSSGGGTRTVTGAFETTHWLDDGSKNTVREAPRNDTALKAILVPDGSAGGYRRIPVSVDASQAFSVPGVPAGSYFAQLDTPIFPPCCGGDRMAVAVATTLIEQRADVLDFGRVTAARADVAFYDYGTLPVSGRLQQFNLSGLNPWASGDKMRVASVQALSYSSVSFSPPPAAGAIGYDGATWITGEGLPDASKGDSVYVYQRSAVTVGSGDTAASVGAASRFVRRTDLTAVPGGTVAVDVALAAVPQTGTIHVDARYSQFAALRAQVHPGASPSGIHPAVSIVAVPRSITYPEMPSFEATSPFVLQNLAAIDRDVDYGSLTYGEFLDASWKSYRDVFYAFDVNPPAPNGFVLHSPVIGTIRSDVLLSEADGPIVPVVGPPTAPRIEGRDAFASQTGVGLQPTFSWSPPTLGSATSYQILIERQSEPADGEMQQLAIILYSGSEFRIPSGFLKPGAVYSVILTARSAPWDVGVVHPPFRTGVPFHSADCVLGLFSP